MSEVKSWLEMAAEDLTTAKLAFEHGLFRQTCFHAQQCAEKALKAFLLSKGENLPRTHNLVDLYEISKGHGFSAELREDLAVLSGFYLPTRYPDAMPSRPLGKVEAEEALNTAERVYRWVKRALGAR